MGIGRIYGVPQFLGNLTKIKLTSIELSMLLLHKQLGMATGRVGFRFRLTQTQPN